MNTPDAFLILKSRYFSYEPYFESRSYYNNMPARSTVCSVIIDSDENYSLGRFKSKLIHYTDTNFSLKSESHVISHDIEKMADRIYSVVPYAKIIMVIREQADWLKSVYKHDVFHFALDCSFPEFLKSDLGKNYLNAGDYNRIWEIYTQRFGKSNVAFFLFEDLKLDESKFLEQLGNFLAVKLIKPSVFGNRNSNENPGDKHIRLLAKINKLSQSKSGRQEYRHYYYLRYIAASLFRNDRSKNLFKGPGEVSFIKDYYLQGNTELASKLGYGYRMKEEGYLK